MKLPLDFRRAEAGDSMLLLEWRNDPLTRQASVDKSLISPVEHESWFASSLQNPKRQIFIVSDGSCPVGSVRFDTNADTCELSWTIRPEVRGQGFGKLMVRQAATMVPGLLVARIETGNLASRRIAEAAGFVLVCEERGLTYWQRQRHPTSYKEQTVND